MFSMPPLTRVFRVTDGERTPLDLLFKQVLLIEEEDDGGVGEPLIVADAVKQLHAFMHAVLWTQMQDVVKCMTSPA